MSQYFPKLFRSFERNINVKVDLSNYATKTDIKNILHVDTSSFARKTSLASLKTEVDKLDIDKLVPVPVDLSKLWKNYWNWKKITDHNHDRYITTPEFNNLAAGVFDARLKQADSVTKTDFDIKLRSLNQKK